MSIIQKINSLHPTAKKVLLGLVGTIIVLSIIQGTSSHTKLLDYVQSKLNADIQKELSEAKAARDKYEAQAKDYQKKFEQSSKEKQKLLKDYNKLELSNTKLSLDLKDVREKYREIRKVRDIYEASEILNELGYSNTVSNSCQ